MEQQINEGNRLIELEKNFKSLDQFQRTRFLVDLLEDGTIQFETLVQSYVDKLKTERTQNDHAKNIFALLLSSYCITDPSEGGKNARRHLYERGMYTGKDGSIFGQQLEKEFGNNNNQTSQK